MTGLLCSQVDVLNMPVTRPVFSERKALFPVETGVVKPGGDEFSGASIAKCFFSVFLKTTMQNNFFSLAVFIVLNCFLAACTCANHESRSAGGSGDDHAALRQAAAQGRSDDSREQVTADSGFELMRSEALGPLRLGLPERKTLELLGEPDEKSRRVVWEADGAEHQTWRCTAKGIELDMVAESEGNNQEIDAISITDPCSFRTKRGTGIGSSRAEVLESYRNEIDRSQQTSPETGHGAGMVVAGTVYGGIIFRFHHNQIAGIFIGAGAE
jgi:hypothetical protein